MNDSERVLWTAFIEGRACDLRVGNEEFDAVESAGEWGPERRIRADVVTRLALGEAQVPAGRAPQLLIRGARITGKLTLRHGRAVCPLLLEECAFDDPLDLTRTELPALSLRGSRLPGLDGYALSLKGDLNLRDVVSGAVDLFGAQISGRIWLVGARLSCADGYALSAPDMDLAGGLYGGARFVAEGGVNLYGTSVGAGAEFDGAYLTNPRAPALRAHNISLGGDLSLIDVQLIGGISLFGADIGGQLWLNGATLLNDEGWALSAPNMSVRGGLYARSGFTADGGVNLYGVSIGAGVELDGATLSNNRGPSLRAPHATVTGDLSCGDGFGVNGGGITLAGARIAGRLSFWGAELGGGGRGDDPVTLDCAEASLGELSLKQLCSVPETVLLTGATIRTIHDDAQFLPAHLDLNRTQYDMLLPHLPAQERLAWLTHGADGHYQPWRYEQLAAYYRRLGHDEDARTVLLAKQRHRRRTLRWPSRLWGYLQDLLVGYGYRPARAFGWLTLGVTLTACYFALFPPTPANGTKGPHPDFSPFIYAVDVLLPVLDLGQQQAFLAHGPGQWLVWASVTGGWILATAVIAGMTRALSRA
ncbi:hypothetical protein [Streptomyces endophytica]|uniref:Membrane-associated oxidoreductase n=1 Tax=Streptomyces endophytica TaxID=2991496 RepID=A0ABY6PGA7_9ACTN|nr:hypothetical protein [Streptomyces endophytica]UZJ32824.1 hypothetical protein OJ254_24240 [Streptomyces endophytica]